jgi:hypothetical protein
MLMQYVAGHGHHVGFRVSNRIVPIHPHQAQEDFLDQVGDIGCIAQAGG